MGVKDGTFHATWWFRSSRAGRLGTPTVLPRAIIFQSIGKGCRFGRKLEEKRVKKKKIKRERTMDEWWFVVV